MSIAIDQMFYVLRNHIFETREAGYKILNPVFKQINITIDKNFISLIIQLQSLYKPIYTPEWITNIMSNHYIVEDLDARKFYSLFYLGCIFLLTGKYRPGVIELSLNLHPDLCSIIDKYDTYFHELIVADFEIDDDNEDEEAMIYKDIFPDGRVLFLDNTKLHVFNPDSNIIELTSGDYAEDYDPEIHIYVINDHQVVLNLPNTIKVWDITNNTFIDSDINTDEELMGSKTRNNIVVFWTYNTVFAWNIDTRHEIAELNLDVRIQNIHFVSDMHVIIVCKRQVYLWDFKELKVVDPEEVIHVLSNGKIVTESDSGIRVWTYTMELLHFFPGPEPWIEVLTNNLLIVNHQTYRYVLNIVTGQIITQLDPSMNGTIKYLPGNKLAVLYPTRIEFWNLYTQTLNYIRKIKDTSHIKVKYGRLIIDSDTHVTIMI